MNNKRLVMLAVIAIIAVFCAFAQNYADEKMLSSEKQAFSNEYKKGLDLCSEKKYEEAQFIFDNLAMNKDAGEFQDLGSYMSAMTLFFKEDYKGAEMAIDQFIKSYPKQVDKITDLSFYKANAVFNQQDYERAIILFQAFISTYPNNENFEFALFGAAECHYNLGHLKEAESLYKTIATNDFISNKEEVSEYRLNLIKFRYREEELLTLLKWSHEESLRVVEEFQRRERAYEQVISANQKRYGDAKRGEEVTFTSLEEQIQGLQKSLDDLTLRYMTKESRVKELEDYIANNSINKKDEVDPNKTKTTDETEKKDNKHVLELKERALNLMQFYLNTIAQSSNLEADK